MGDDLAKFLKARLDEDEQAARRAGETFRQIGETGIIVATEGDRAEECASANWTGIAEHIVRHDPARVLREVEAKRQLVREISTLTEFDWGEPDGSMRSDYVEAFRRVLRIHALPYADHPDYREEWRP